VLLTKVDLLPYLNIDVHAIERNLERTMPSCEMIPVSSITGGGVDHWIEWLESKRRLLSEVSAP
jgi:hydrogenase nickel incorporation protein HypB